ncbi:hypothetical protein [Flavobacterium gelatinilyticum]|uniref:hypothetical protein n=1 Tax=Flavobacterium gelatinilyticum TaxID=3003260 RepID=UPI0024814097|nr:hypothetical protein [Flavobacterium gelatinilyticum]
MIKKIIQITASFILVLMLISCKNTKQKLQEYVTTYKSTAASFKAEDVTLTTARGYINDNKIELRFETALEQNEANKVKANTAFPALLKQVADRDPIFTELVNEGVQFHVYYLADDNTVLLKEVVNKETLPELLK